MNLAKDLVEERSAITMEGKKKKKVERRPEIELPDDFDLSEEFAATFDLIENTEKNVYITGDAGTGKSTFLKYFMKSTNKNFVVLAPTGIAGINIGGQTIHSFFNFPPHFIQKSDVRKLSSSKKKLVNKLDILIIDEASMVRADLLDAIDYSLRLNLDKMNVPFGGKQIILVGDMAQLPPVVVPSLREIMDKMYQTPYFFSANVFNEAKVSYVELTKQYRQKDSCFIESLNKIRNNTVNGDDLRTWNQRVADGVLENNPAILTMTNEDAASINKDELEELDTEEYSFKAKIDGWFGRTCPTEKTLVLKKGAQVMMLTNCKHSWGNGTIAIVKELSEDSIQVLIDGEVHDVSKHTWKKKLKN